MGFIARHKRKLLILSLIAVAFIILPTGTPEDLVTTVLFIKLFGVRSYLAMAIVGLLCLAVALKLGWSGDEDVL